MPALLKGDPLPVDDHLIDGCLIEPEFEARTARYHDLGVKQLRVRDVADDDIRVTKYAPDNGLGLKLPGWVVL